MNDRRILAVIGTRPEVVKMAPVIAALRARPGFVVRLCITRQHRDVLDEMLEAFELVPDIRLDLGAEGDLATLHGNSVPALHQVIQAERPMLVLAQGDTTTVLTTALACFYARVPFAHVEAGLRSGDFSAPWPEEMNRTVAARLATLHFAPTMGARLALLDERVPKEAIHVTGNPVVDAIQQMADKVRQQPAAVPGLPPDWVAEKRFALVTAHRRENYLGEGLANICEALADLVSQHPDLHVVYPVHFNPEVDGPVRQRLAGIDRVHLLPPLPYRPFVTLLAHCALVLTDSGGLQEEAATLGKPVLVLRDRTERPEAVAAGLATVVGTDRERILAAAQAALAGRRSARQGPVALFGDGLAGERIAAIIERWSHTFTGNSA